MKDFFYVTVLICFTPIAGFADGVKVMDVAKKSIVYINAETASGTITGSGVIVLQDEILTNCHVIKDAEKITVQFDDDEKMPASVKGKIEGMDMCVLTALTNKHPKTSIIPLNDVKIGQPVFAIGNPMGLKFTISDGIISSLRGSSTNKLIQITAPISPGSSGGGVFDSKGKLLGITTFTLTEGQNHNFAIPASYRNTLEIVPIDNSNATNQISKAKNVTFKGIAFGSSIKEFKEVYPDANCNWVMEDHPELGKFCKGRAIEYLGRTAPEFFASFKNDKLTSVNVFFELGSAINPLTLQSMLTEKVYEYFGAASTGTFTVKGEVIHDDSYKDWSIKNAQGDYYIFVRRCDSENWILGCKSAGAQVVIRGNLVSKNKSDF